MPLTVLPARRCEREGSVQGETEVEAEPGVEKVLVTGMALLSTGAAVIHFAVIAQHFDEWWLAGTFFLGVALFQLAWAVAVVLWPSGRVYLAGAVVNGLVVLTRIVSRTTRIPVGPEAGEPEAIGFAGRYGHGLRGAPRRRRVGAVRERLGIEASAPAACRCNRHLGRCRRGCLAHRAGARGSALGALPLKKGQSGKSEAGDGNPARP